MSEMAQAEKLLRGLTDVKEEYILEMENTNRRRTVRRLPLALAAVLALALLCGGVAAAVYGDTLGDWFDRTWTRITGREMGEGHRALIDSLTQEIGMSETVGSVTVTVDSATVGEDRVFVLLRVDGIRGKEGATYGLEPFGFDLERDTGEPNVIGTQAVYTGLDGTGALLFLVEYDGAVPFLTPENRTLPAALTVGSVTMDRGGKTKELAAGPWSFEFQISLSEASQSRSLGNVEAEIDDAEGGTVPFTAEDVTVTSTGLQFVTQGGTEAPEPWAFAAVLADGTVISCHEGGGVCLDETARFFRHAVHWEIPLDLEDVTALRIGETTIPLK